MLDQDPFRSARLAFLLNVATSRTVLHLPGPFPRLLPPSSRAPALHSIDVGRRHPAVQKVRLDFSTLYSNAQRNGQAVGLRPQPSRPPTPSRDLHPKSWPARHLHELLSGSFIMKVLRSDRHIRGGNGQSTSSQPSQRGYPRRRTMDSPTQNSGRAGLDKNICGPLGSGSIAR